MAFYIELDASRAFQKLNSLEYDVKDKATAAALNKVAAKAKSEMTRQITSEFNIKASDVRSQLTIRKASAKNNQLTAVLVAFGKNRGHRSRNVMLFDAKQVPGTGPKKRVRVQVAPGVWRTLIVQAGGGVSVTIKRSGGAKLIKGAFIGNKGRTVFIRTGNARLPIKAVETIDVPQMFNTRPLKEAVVKKIRDDFPLELRRAISLYANGTRPS